MSKPNSKSEIEGVSGSQQALADVRDRIAEAIHGAGRDGETVELVAVSKTFDAAAIVPVLEAGQRVFGENRVQEALGKWPDLKHQFVGTKLHLIGPLQSNKAADAVALFDVIETVDRPKIAKVLAGETKRQGREIELFVQVNTGAEPQKAGVMPEEADEFVKLCRDEFGLKIAGLMCIPPFDEEPALHFALLSKIAERNHLENLSMGMSSDFETAIAFGATHVRVGSAIFGPRTQKIA